MFEVSADFGNVGFSEVFRHWFFASRAAKIAAKNGAVVTVRRRKVEDE